MNVKSEKGDVDRVMKRNLERWIHWNMTFIGGFVGVYAFLNHTDLFGSAQTANLIRIVTGILGHNVQEVLLRAGGLIIYTAGLVCAAAIKHTHINIKLFSLAVDAACIMGLGFLPADLNHFVALYPLFFMTAIQWSSFNGADGFVSSCMFSTNNLRQFTESIVEYLFDRDKKHMRKAKFYGAVLLAFHLGAAAGYLASGPLSIKAAWLCLFPVLTGFILVWRENTAVLPVPEYAPDPSRTADARSFSASSASSYN